MTGYRNAHAAARRAPLFWLGLASLVAFSFGWVWLVGHRGLFVLDESIMFDGAWRIHQGQVPYRDFYMPFGPMAFALTALAFRVAGVDFSSLVLTASLLSVSCTLASARLTWLLTRRSRGLSLLAGGLTAVWFQAPFGIPWMEQTAFFFDLLALLLICEGRLRAGGQRLLFTAAGVASVAAVLSKQNAGGLFVPVCLGALLLPLKSRWREALRDVNGYARGLGLGALGFALWLWLYSDVGSFLHYFIDLSAKLGAGRVEYYKVWGTLFFQTLIGGSIPLFFAATVVAALALCAARAGAFGRAADEETLSAWLCLALPQFHNLFQLTTNNDAANNNAFVGVAAACTFALVRRLREAGDLSSASVVGLDLAARSAFAPLGRVVAGLLVVATGYSVVEGLMIAHARNVQEFPPGASFANRLKVKHATRLAWGEPTHITPQFCATFGEMCKISSVGVEADRGFELLKQQDFERLVGDLQRRNRNFFVFPDTTILYGLTGRPSPQPLLYFHPQQSFLLEDRASLAHAIVAGLQKHAVELVVLERASFMGTHRLLADFPELQRYIEDNFVAREEFGNYRLLEKKTSGTSTLATR